mmetsp:Transcript_19387/g.38892  ORF Transcript_19387/g.38892 Transcript_19387/m.38892 type:complete len:275 (-) Transcript_19387:55-879(-)
MPARTPSKSNSKASKAIMLISAVHITCRNGVRSFQLVSSLPPLLSRSFFAPLYRSTYQNSRKYSLISQCGKNPFTPSIWTLHQQSNGDNVDQTKQQDFENTWTYLPYKAPPPPKNPKSRFNNNNSTRQFSNSANDDWTVPEFIQIPEDQLQISFSRSSGAGGQNVNKVNTKVELRFHLDSAKWIPQEVRQRLKSNESNRISNEGMMTVTSQEYRTQAQNRKDALKKLEDILRNSWARPKVRKMRKGLSKKTKENRREMKKRIGEKKASRRRVEF